MNRVLQGIAGMLVAVSLAGCCCQRYRHCCGPGMEYGASYGQGDCCGADGYAAGQYGPSPMQTGCSACGGQSQAMAGPAGMQFAANTGCTSCNNANSMMGVPMQNGQPYPVYQNGQPMPMYDESTPGQPTPAPPIESRTFYPPSVPPVVEEPAPLPEKDASRLQNTRQLRYVPGRL